MNAIEKIILPSFCASVAALSILGCVSLAQRAAKYGDEHTPAPEPPQEIALAAIEPTPEVLDLVEPVEVHTAPEPEPVETQHPAAELIGRTIWGEAGGVVSEAERAAVAWCILNRVDAWGQSIEEVVTKPWQFQGYRPEGDCPQEHIDLANDVLQRWEAEKRGEENVGRVLPAEYIYFLGDGARNHFTAEYYGTDYWDWSAPDPYQ